MQLKAEALAAHLARGPLAPIYVISGEEPLVALEAADAIRAAARAAGFSEREVIHAQANSDWSWLAAGAHNLALFAAKRLIDLRLPTGRPGVQGAAALVAYASQPPPHALLLLSLPRLEAATRRAAWAQALERAGVWVEAARLSRAQLPSWIQQRLARQQQRAREDALAFLCDRVEGNLLAAQQEIAKLGLLYPTGELTREQVEAAVLDVARFETYDLSQALLAGDGARAVRIVQSLRAEGEPLPLVLWAVTEELRLVARAQQVLAQQQSLASLRQEFKLWGTRERLLPAAAQRMRDVDQLLVRCAQVDRIAKGLQVPSCDSDPWLELAELVLAACQ
ncbi:MAG: DNA polymerase III subunit delta [Sutterellaceae bacterium]|nr:DNA polymerase III subunit delta [Burkholderiaceae bacterium]MCX7902327.1 DNA polymerase III subunit delta [Burkholderiaceae bacterium]MDW8429466.1 DNA polymerase III subunit delta [Sutterellaceae bacterium]